MNKKVIAKEILKTAKMLISDKSEWLTSDATKKKVYKWLSKKKNVKNLKETNDGYTFDGEDYLGQSFEPYEAKIDFAKGTVTISMIKPQVRNVLKLDELK